ncbi:MAG TPA: HAMP domain-containing sensor histidine kinase [Kofleriaceae bacterium]|nr:HAMP domain-containing sensor histidine kinase [Kofleriaceae bacterium]
MRLRTRLAVATLAVTAPMVLGLMWLDGRARHRAAEFVLGDGTARRLQDPELRARCEAAPASWGKPRLRPPPAGARARHPGHAPGPPGGTPPLLYAYDERLVSTNPDAPALDPALRRALDADHDTYPLPARWYHDDVLVLVRTPWATGPCAYVLARGTTSPGFLGALLPASRIWLLPLVAVMIAILVAVGPVIARIRRLTAAVRRTADAGFAHDVDIGGRDEVGELARAFDHAGREVRAQLAAKDQRERALRDFLANTTHDVMIPLTVLQAHLATLREHLGRGTPADPAVLTSAMDEAHYIGALLHNLAVTAKLAAVDPGLLEGQVDLNALVARVVSRHAPIARQRAIALEHAVPDAALTTTADVTLLEQAVSNVVYNAVRHNRTGGHVALILERRDDDRFRIRVIDDGPGIPPEQLERLFERGQRGDQARTRAPDGQGLGLDIATRVARLHGHDLRFGPSEFGGLQVDLEGPLRAAGDDQDEPSSRRSDSITSA